MLLFAAWQFTTEFMAKLRSPDSGGGSSGLAGGSPSVAAAEGGPAGSDKGQRARPGLSQKQRAVWTAARESGLGQREVNGEDVSSGCDS